ELVTEGFSEGLRPRLHSGRGFEAGDHNPNATPVALISYRYWQDELGGDPDALGTTIEVRLGSPSAAPEESATAYRIIGIMSPEMTGLRAYQAGLWLPLEQARGLDGIASMLTFGRRSAGASTRAVREELNTRYGDGGDGFRLEPGTRFDAADGLTTNIFVQRD